MLVAALVVLILTTTCIFGWRILLESRFRSEVKRLLSGSDLHPCKQFHEVQLTGLPDPAQRYFRHVMKEGQPYINSVKLTHDGWFKTGQRKAWTAIKGEEHFTAMTPGFIWKGTTKLFTAIDQYIGGKGCLQVFLISFIRIVKAKGEKYDQGELMRWLSEGVWFPTALLPGKYLKWSAINENTARLVFGDEGLSVSFLVTFNDQDEIAQMETERFMGAGKSATWITKMTAYKERNGIKIPTRAEAMWRLEDADFSYARFHLKTIRYNTLRNIGG